jgi:hypothetical protein
MTLQLALTTGDAARIERECRHLDRHTAYGSRLRAILDSVRRRNGALA